MAPHSETIAGPAATAAHILIVDDDPIMRELASTKLSEAGYAIAVAQDGAEGLERLRAEHIDLVITDLDMPRVSGFQLTTEMRASPRFRETPVIVITGSDSSAAVDRAFAVGATSFLAKPINWSLLSHSVRFVLKAAQDQIALRRSRDQAKAGERFKDTLMSLMSHELRTPLNAIIGFGQLLGEQFDRDGDAIHREYADYIVDGGKRLLNSVSDMLLASDSRAGPISINELDCTLEDLIEPALDGARKSADLASVTFDVAVHNRDVELRCDRQMIARAIGKLLDNAVKFAPPKSHVIVGTGETRTGDLAILVKDNGPGIDPVKLDGVIKPFAQLDMSLGRSQEGLGLGLPLVHAIAEAHGGRLKLVSAPGQDRSASSIDWKRP